MTSENKPVNQNKEVKTEMKFLKNIRGQGLVEYTLIVLLVALVFWVAVKNTNIDAALKNGWTQIVTCLNATLTCGESK